MIPSDEIEEIKRRLDVLEEGLASIRVWMHNPRLRTDDHESRIAELEKAEAALLRKATAKAES